MILTTTYHYSNPETHRGGRQLPATGPEMVRYCVVPLMKLWDMEDRENFDLGFVCIEWDPFPRGVGARKYMYSEGSKDMKNISAPRVAG